MLSVERKGWASSIPRQDERETREQFKFIVKPILGAGILGAAIALIGKEGFQLWGILALLIIFIFAGFLFIWSEKQVSNRVGTERKINLQELNKQYIGSFATTGTILIDKLKLVENRNENLEPSIVLNILVKDLIRQTDNINRWYTKEEINQGPIGHFIYGIEKITESWQSYIKESGSTEELWPEGAQPIR